MCCLSRQFPSFLVPLSQNECSCKDISNEIEFDLRENEPVGETQFDLKGFRTKTPFNMEVEQL